MEDFAVTCPLVPSVHTSYPVPVPRIKSGAGSAPRVWIGLPPDPTLRWRPCPSPSLRLCLNLARGLAPRQFCAMPGTHAEFSGTG